MRWQVIDLNMILWLQDGENNDVPWKMINLSRNVDVGVDRFLVFGSQVVGFEQYMCDYKTGKTLSIKVNKLSPRSR